MPWKYSDEYYREYTRATWNESAEAYVALMRSLEPFRGNLLSVLAVREGERVLDLGTGPGEPALTIARMVGPKGRVTGVDLSENMISIAQRVAAARSVQNAEFRVMDSSALGFEGAAFDAVISSFGFQIFTDPEKAAREARRVLSPGGRIAVAVWSTGDKVPYLDAIVGPMLKHAEPDETGYIPTPYEMGGAGEMISFLEAAGFQKAEETRVSHRMVFDDEERYLQMLLKATPIGHSLSEETPEIQREVLAETRANLQQWKTAEGISLPAECVLVVARK